LSHPEQVNCSEFRAALAAPAFAVLARGWISANFGLDPGGDGAFFFAHAPGVESDVEPNAFASSPDASKRENQPGLRVGGGRSLFYGHVPRNLTQIRRKPIEGFDCAVGGQHTP